MPSRLLTTSEALDLIQQEAAAERAAAGPDAPDPCPWVGVSTSWIYQVAKRTRDPLPCVTDQKGKHRLFDSDAVLTWFAEEFERRQDAEAPDLISTVATGVLITATAVATELGMHPNTMAQRLRTYSVKPARANGKATYYRLRDIIRTLTEALKTDDPDSLPPRERDAHWRAEARKDELLRSRGDLVPVDQARAAFGRLAGVLRDFYDLIPDMLEHRCGLSADALSQIQAEIDSARSSHANAVESLLATLLAEPKPEPAHD